MQISQKASNIYLACLSLLVLIPVSIVTLIFGHTEASNNYIFPKLNDQTYLNCCLYLYLNFLSIGDAPYYQ